MAKLAVTLLRSGAFVLFVACSSDSEGDGPGNPEGAPIIERFEIEPGGLGTEGGDVTLTWSVTGAENIQIDPGVGSIDGSEVTVTIRETTLFTLTATNDQGSTEASTVGLVASAGPPLIDRSARTAADQIDDALALGEIDEVTALRYKVFALHGDERLPAEFDADGPVHGSPIMLELAQRFEELPMEVQEELQPFLVPPNDPGSWYVARKSFDKKGGSPLWEGPVTAADARVEIRWDASLSSAQQLYTWGIVRDAATRSYRTLTELMGRAPIGDGADPDVYPVYVLSNPARGSLGWVTSTSIAGGVGKSHMTINLDGIMSQADGSPDLSVANLVSATVAHELFHGVQRAYGVDRRTASEKWLRESTATWAEHFVYPRLNTEHIRNENFFRRPYISLDDLRETHEYGGYLFHLYVIERLGDSQLVRRFWEEAERQPVFPAINEVLDDQLVDLFAEFVVANWNDGEIRDYRIWDDLDEGVSQTSHGAPFDYVVENRTRISGLLLGVDDPGVVGPSIPGVRPLSAQYFHFRFEDENTRSLLFANGFNYELARGAPSDLPIEYDGDEYYARIEPFADLRGRNLRTQILVKNQGQWSGPYDLTTVPFVAFCQDLPEEKLEEIVIIFANANFEEGERLGASPRGINPQLFGSNMACGRWEGNAGGTETATPAPGNPDLSLLEFSEVVFNKLVFSREPTPIEELVEGSPSTMTLGNYVFAAFLNPSYRYELTDAEVDWTVTYSQSDPGQSCQGEGSITLDETQLFGSLQTFNHFLPNDPKYRSYFIDVSPAVGLAYDVTCDVSGVGERSKSFALSNLGEEPFRIADDGVSILDFTESMTDGGVATYLELWSWELSGAPLQSAP